MTNYCEIGDVDRYANENGYAYWSNVSQENKTLYINYATLDIEDFHQQPRDYGAPWGMGLFLDECILQTLYIARTINERTLSEKISTVTDKNYQDSNISVDARGSFNLYPLVKRMVSNRLLSIGASNTEFGRG